MTNPRLDEWLVENGHYKTRARARDAIGRGCVSVGGDLTAKPSRKVTDPGLVVIQDPAQHYVSRAALKLSAALDETGYDPSGKICVDLGASTGGFCQVLLERGAKRVYGVDVGHDQLDASLRTHPDLVNLEGINARELALADLNGERPAFVTSDVSFISLRLALPPALELAETGAAGIFLVKPQFEVGRNHIGRGGIVRDQAKAEEAAFDVRSWFENQAGWQCTHFMQSPIEGGDGNREYLMAGRKS